LCIAYNIDGNIIATGGGDDCLKFWDSSLGTEIYSVKLFSKSVNSVAFSNQTKDLYMACSLEKNIKILKGIPVNVLHTLTGHRDIINDCKFAKNEDIVITAGSDRVIKIWDVERGTTNY
jgi:WD40 repeat protein